MIVTAFSTVLVSMIGVTTPASITSELLDKLKAAPDEETAQTLEEQVWDAWGASGSAVVDILMKRAIEAGEEGNAVLARDMLDRVIMLKPEWAEGWYRRASLFFNDGKYEEALQDLEAALEREPRHFGAWVGLAMIFESIDRPRAALQACRKALEVHPFFATAKQCQTRLIPRVDGRAL
jgi:tetratricopeptide (TPR) repeat protein